DQDFGGITLQSVLWHELAHAYDVQEEVSKKRKFLYLNHWRRGLTGYQAGNKALRYLFDPYQNVNPSEGFAVGFEAFMGSAEFSQRRPNLYRFFKDEFQVDPFPQRNHSMPESSVTLRKGLLKKETFVFDKERFYGADYLYATPGKSQSSRWGHSMLRLVFCRPGRAPSEECRKDINHHIVVSFRADPGFSLVKPVLGIFGGYVSKIFLMSMSQIIHEYTRSSDRELRSFPLRLNDAEKDRFLASVQETYWVYRGRYWFLTNNCATETLRLLKNTYQNEKFYKARIITPKGVYSALRKHRKISPNLLQNRAFAIKKSYLFPSIEKALDAGIYKITRRKAMKRNVFLKKFSSDRRFRFYKSHLFLEKLDVIRFLKLEEWAKEQWQRTLNNRTLRSPSTLRLLQDLHDTLESSTLEGRRFSGYGIPVASDFLDSSTSPEELERVLQEKKAIYIDALDQSFPRITNEIDGVDKNKLLLIENLKTFLKKSKLSL
ncbi:MAG: DUF4105 domain-containing protein, partial [Oligoflexales bacterium]